MQSYIISLISPSNHDLYSYNLRDLRDLREIVITRKDNVFSQMAQITQIILGTQYEFKNLRDLQNLREIKRLLARECKSGFFKQMAFKMLNSLF
jgi:hypothetical protein